MPKALKGGGFEREMCKVLSLWWTDDIDIPREDVFWRTSQSGGRATQRKKSGKDTYGSHGDIAAVDPIGVPLIKFATIELKRGYSHGIPWDLVESSPSKAVRIFEGALIQAKRSAEQAGSLGWLLIGRRDRKVAMVYMEWSLYKLLLAQMVTRKFQTYVIFNLLINLPDDFPTRFKFIAVPLKEWLQVVTPKQIIKCVS